MKRLLATSAVALLALSGAASAQSVLERVLGAVQAVNADTTNVNQLNGIFANIAENVGIIGGGTATYYQSGSDLITQTEYDALYDAALAEHISTEMADNDLEYSDPDDDGPLGAMWHSPSNPDLGNFATQDEAETALQAALAEDFEWTAGAEWSAVEVDLGVVSILNAIDGSITNTIAGLTVPGAQAGDAVVYVVPEVHIGDLSTTALGAVNTGEITLGVNQGVSEAIGRGASAVSASINQLGGSAGTGTLVLNIASNSTDVVARVTNSFGGVDGSIGDVATTALGAVNTGTITSGINAAVNGIQAGIIGASN